MEIIEIYPSYLYAIQYENEAENEFDRLLDEWNDMEIVVNFMEENKIYLSNKEIWGSVLNTEDAAKRVRIEAEKLEDLFDQLYEHTCNGEKPDFDTHFRELKGKYVYELTYIPMKSYGVENPSMLRFYAIKIKSNLYIITGGGIKLSKSIQNSPGIKDHVIQNIDKVRQFLKVNGIQDIEDI
jgi:hypothetical protein